jgi:hypothetical protein
MAAAGQWRWKMLAVRQHWEVALGGGLRLQQRRCAEMAEEHATMVSVSASVKLRAYYYDVGISVGKDSKRGCV